MIPDTKARVRQLGQILLVATCIVTSSTASADNNDNAAPRQLAVENGLRPRVRFEEPETFNLAEGMLRTGVPGVSIAVIKNGRLDWSAGYGKLDALGDVPVTEDTLFQVASISKPVTVLAAMRMQEAGLIDFDQDIHAYLKTYELPVGKQSATNPVTFRNLLSHTAGVVAGGYMGYPVGADIPTDKQILTGKAPANTSAILLDHEPGEKLAYSGGGYTLAEQAMQDLAGEPFDKLMNDWVVAPLGMEGATFAQPLPAALQGNAARGHTAGPVPIEGGWMVHPEQAAAGMWSSASDLAKILIEIYAASNSHSDLLTEANARSLITEQRDSHAWGFRIDGKGKTLSISHFGANQGYRAMMILYPSTGDGAVILTNADNGIALANHVARSIAGTYSWPNFQQIVSKKISLPDAGLKAFAGSYRFANGIEVKMTFDINLKALVLHFPNGDQYVMVPTAPREFIHADTGVTIRLGEKGALHLYGDVATLVHE